MVLGRLSAEAGNQIRRDRTIGHAPANGRHPLQIPGPGIFPVHRGEHPVATRLRRQMDRPTHVGMRSHHLDQPIAQVLGVRCGETHPEQRRHARHPFHESGKVDSLFGPLHPTVGVDVLPQQRHLPITGIEQLPRLAQNGLRIAAALPAPRIGHHTIGTEVIASAHDGDECAHAVAVEAHGSYIAVGLLLRQLHVHSVTACRCHRHQPGQIAIGVGTGYHIHDGFAFEQLLPQPFGHAPHDAHHQSLAGPFITVELPEPSPYTLLGIVAYGTRIHQNDIGLRDLFGIAIPLVLHDGNENLAVADIHLAAVCFYIEPLPVTGKRP